MPSPITPRPGWRSSARSSTTIADNARRFLATTGATWPSVTDPDASIAQAWRVVAPPQTYFIGRDGIIASRQIGEVTRADLDRQLAAILK